MPISSRVQRTQSDHHKGGRGETKEIPESHDELNLKTKERKGLAVEEKRRRAIRELSY